LSVPLALDFTIFIGLDMATNGMWRSKLGSAFPRAEIERLDVEHHRILKKLRSQPGNDRCAECGTKETTWSSVNLGVFLCVRCADVHRALGTHISKVKGCGGTYLWGPDEIAHMQSLGNFAWSSDGVFADSSAGKEELLRICRKKYENEEDVWGVSMLCFCSRWTTLRT